MTYRRRLKSPLNIRIAIQTILSSAKKYSAVYTIVSEHAVIAQKLGVADNARSSNRAAIVRSPIPYVYVAPLGKLNGADKNAAIKSTKYLPMR